MDAKTSPRQAMLKAKQNLGALFFEREEKIRRLLVALLYLGNTCCFVGPPLEHLAKPVVIAPSPAKGAIYQRLSKI